MVTEKTHENKLRLIESETQNLLKKKEVHEKELQNIQERLDQLKTLKTRLENHFKKLQSIDEEYAKLANSITGPGKKTKAKKEMPKEEPVIEKTESEPLNPSEDPEAFMQFMEM